ALKVDIIADMGSMIVEVGGIPALGFTSLICGPYRTAKAAAHTTGVYTNRAPISPYRGAGRPEAIYSLERALDLAARAIGMDPSEVRRRNFIAADEFPYTTPTR